MKLCFGISDLELVGFSDVDFKNDVDRKSTSKQIFFFGGTIVY